ncbi:MAG TPA: glycosyltransferase [Humidesulfovibrio sp.]|uniref:CgeB family protein n=1 Tax=Humidesulfovibrio sp. TaxID=2910988 RepID=UPI002C0A0E75|nr:glycosyltransferase [Humidesulfovibrio sp.]HWR03462.1 glycosyltransferase [Humidesulfovibrio sp.]
MPAAQLTNTLRRRHRVLLIGQDYFVVPELERALRALGVAVAVLPFAQNAAFVRQLLLATASFRPSFILTVNHVGLDGQGHVLDLLRSARAPLASWFVDNHETYLQRPAAPDARLMVFTWNPESVAALDGGLVPRAQYLPLGADPGVFAPANPTNPTEDAHGVGFVGGTWAANLARTMRAGRFPATFLRRYRELGALLAAEPDLGAEACLRRHAPELWEEIAAANPEGRALHLELLRQEATRLHRLRAVRALLPLRPVIAGSRLWERMLGPGAAGRFTWRPGPVYGPELAAFYRSLAVNVNITSLKSRASLNQRVFDAPLCGGFLLTEASEALAQCFESGVEAACYKGPEDLAEQARHWLADAAGRVRTVRAAQKRILAEHTYAHRAARIIETMDAAF